MSGPVLVLLDPSDAHGLGMVGETLACARRVADIAKATVRVAAWRGDGFAEFQPRATASSPAVREAAWLVFPHTIRGSAWAAGVAACLSAPIVTAVEAVESSGDGARLRRKARHGRLHQWTACEGTPCVITIQPGAFAAETGNVEPDIVIDGQAFELEEPRFVERVDAPKTEAALHDAEVVVAVGRGIGDPEMLVEIERVAASFSRGAVAGSRPVCDAGWLPMARQVGQTGATVRPKVYVALGISGASQHVAGMRESGFIIAVDRDTDAPIFRMADVGIVEDLRTFLPALLAALAGE